MTQALALQLQPPLPDSGLRAVLNQIEDHLALYDEQWRYRFVTDRGAAMVGKTVDELLGRSIWELFPEAVGNLYHQKLHEAARNRQVVRFEHYYEPFARWYDNQVYPVPEGIAVFSVDITQRKIAEQALSDMRQRHEALLEIIPAGVYMCEAPSGTIRYYNRRAAELWGRKPDVSAGTEKFCGSLKILTNDGEPLPHDRSPIVATLLQGARVRNAEAVVERPDGTQITVMANAEPILDADGKVMGAINVFQDISDYKADERALRVSEERYRSLVEASGAIVYACDPEAKWYLRNAAWEDFTGQSFEEYQGYGWAAAVHPDDRERVQASVARAIATKTTWHEEGRLWHAATRSYRWQEARSVPILNADGSIREWIGTCLDIHARRCAEDAVREADRRKDEFLAVLAHELRNPLAPIVSSVQILRMPQAEMARSGALDVLDRQVHHLVRLVDDLMEVARITRGTIELRRETLPMSEPIRAAVEISRQVIEARDHQLDVAMVPETLLVYGDRVRLTQVIANLLTNAAKYTPRSGRIRVAIERRDAHVLVSVTDNGIGVRPEAQERVFEMFARAGGAVERFAGGLGIGLSLARRLAQLHGGDVTLSSAGEGKGSTFTLQLPLSAAVSVAPAAQPHAAAGIAQRVLVVDDNRDAAITLATLLRALGQEVHTVHDGEEALRLAARLKPDVVLLDLGMPPPDGFDVARQLRALPDYGQRVKIVAVTGWGQPADRERSAQSGFDLHLVKPLGMDDVRKALGSS